ncbi:trehalose-phosphatase [Mycolicibacterium mengxianglii]|uniref:trehalose-phosphatase n=1 Tax=Mycolicibacterium mengxianglii TaxID=2736649 RepID=UPI001E613F08|nr:trehalose-phosphatase [Mycolicibacterium mengxianglii]
MAILDFDDDIATSDTEAINLSRRLSQVGIRARVRSRDHAGTDGDLERPTAARNYERAVLITDSPADAAAGRAGGFALVIGLGNPDDREEFLRRGADVVVNDLAEVVVHDGDHPMTALPDAVESEGQLRALITSREPLICLDFDGTLSAIVADPGQAHLVPGAAEALEELAGLCPVAILSGRDLSDIRTRVALPGLWYAGSHGMELLGPDGTTLCPAGVGDSELAQAAATMTERLAAVPGARIEPKRYAVTVHYRNVAPQYWAEVIRTARDCARQHGLRTLDGRKVIELQPDFDWNKGTALSWIRDHVVPGERGLPIYIGDDLTDEDAFDAIRLSGVPVVVQHNEAGGRPTAAQYSVRDPAEVCEFLRLCRKWLAHERDTKAAWSFSFDGYDPPNEKLREALSTVGNGYFATRGAAPETRAGQLHYPGTYVAGIYNRLVDVVAGRQTQHESLVNLPNWLPLTFRIQGGDWFDVDAVPVLRYRQTLDLRSAVLTREMRFRDTAGRTTTLTQQRFASMHQPHVAALTTTIVAEDWSGTVEVRSTLDGRTRNLGVERYRDLSSTHLCSVRTMALSDDSVLMTAETNQSHVQVAVACRTRMWLDGSVTSVQSQLVDDEFETGHEIAMEVAVGQSLSVEKVATIVTGRDVATSDAGDAAARRLTRLGRICDIRRAHDITWSQLWERLDITFDGHIDELRILRLHMLHLLQTVSPNTDDLDVGVPARGLHGEAYRGHIFWDEVFIFPVLNLRFPAISRALLRYRYRRLEEARRAAALTGYRGAMFPWQSGSDGREESPEVHLNPRSGRWNPDSSRLAHHIGTAVAYNVWQYYQTSGDLAYLIDQGAELLIEIARFWVSRTTHDPTDDRYRIDGVIGPDEFHSGYPDAPTDGVDNNAYTNVMAAWVIVRALDALETMPLPRRLDLLGRLSLSDSELAHWDEVSRHLYVPFHDGMISQFDGYENLEELDWESYRARYPNIQRLDRILEAEGDDVNRYKVSKQADVLMLLYLLSSDELRELLARLGYRLAPERIPEMVTYYLARTSNGSTLSALTNTWVLARANRDRAKEFFQQVLISDVADIQGGTTSEGVHLAAMAGSVDLIQRCFTGLETRRDRIVLSPCWPPDDGPLTFSMHYRGHHLFVRISGRGAQISAAVRDVAPIIVECRGQVQQLSAGGTVRFPDA